MPTALITGAAVRVGRAISLALAEAGYDLILHAHLSRAEASAVASEVRARGRRAELILADLATEQGVAQTIAETSALTPALDVLVNNASIYERRSLEELSRDDYRRAMAINAEAPLWLSRGLAPLFANAATACIINITDAALARPYPEYIHYVMSKAALDAMTRALAVELAPKIRVNNIAPGTVIFPESFDPQKRDRIRQRIPMGREGTPEDIGRAVVFLVRDAPFITGHTLAVDGGASLT